VSNSDGLFMNGTVPLPVGWLWTAQDAPITSVPSPFRAHAT